MLVHFPIAFTYGAWTRHPVAARHVPGGADRGDRLVVAAIVGYGGTALVGFADWAGDVTRSEDPARRECGMRFVHITAAIVVG